MPQLTTESHLSPGGEQEFEAEFSSDTGHVCQMTRPNPPASLELERKSRFPGRKVKVPLSLYYSVYELPRPWVAQKLGFSSQVDMYP